MINGIQFINGRRWVDTYYNGVKIAGSQLVEVSGEMLSVPNTYDDSAYLKINGRTVEIGEGDKGPDNPYELRGTGDFDLVSAGKNLFDKTKAVLGYRLGGAGTLVALQTAYVSDYIPVIPTATYYLSNYAFSQRYAEFYDDNKNFASSVLLPVGGADTSIVIPNNAVFLRISGAISALDTTQLELGNTATPYTPFRGMQTVHIPYMLRSLPDGTKDYIEIDNVQKRAWYQHILKKDTLSAGTSWTLSDAKPNSAFMSTHISSGYLDGNILTSVEEITEEFEVIYELAEQPEPIELDYTAVRTYYPYTNIYTISTVQPTLEAKIRVWEA